MKVARKALAMLQFVATLKKSCYHILVTNYMNCVLIDPPKLAAPHGLSKMAGLCKIRINDVNMTSDIKVCTVCFEYCIL